MTDEELYIKLSAVSSMVQSLSEAGKQVSEKAAANIECIISSGLVIHVSDEPEHVYVYNLLDKITSELLDDCEERLNENRK